jgi:hypothetical protein
MHGNSEKVCGNNDIIDHPRGVTSIFNSQQLSSMKKGSHAATVLLPTTAPPTSL